MSSPHSTVVSIFPPGIFTENITYVPGGGLFVTVAMRSELYYIPLSTSSSSSKDKTLFTPFLLQKFPHDQATMGIINAPHDPNVFYLLTSDLLSIGAKKSYLYLLDLGNAATAATAHPLMTFPSEARGLNGLCALSDSVLLAADSFGEKIWRIDVSFKAQSDNVPTRHKVVESGTARCWLSDHNTMQGVLQLPDFQPGTNGVKYSPRTGYVCYTSTQQKLFCRVAVDPSTLDPVGGSSAAKVEVVARGMQGDDLIIDDEWQDEKTGETRSVAYVTTHRDNTVLRIPIDEDAEIEEKRLEVLLEGKDEDDTMTGPTAGVWEVGKEGKTAYFTCDGGLKNPLSNGIVRCAKVVRVDF